jgi:hypothetical protein
MARKEPDVKNFFERVQNPLMAEYPALVKYTDSEP